MELNRNDRRGDYHLPSEDRDRKRTDKVFVSKKRVLCFAVTVVFLVILSAVIGTLVSLKSESHDMEQEAPRVSNRTRKTTDANTSKDDAWKHYRLPRRILPQHYWLTVRINMTSDVFHGKVTILMKVYENTGIIMLHTDPYRMKYDKIEIENSRRSAIKVKNVRLYNEYLIIEAGEILTRGQSYYLKILYQAPFGRYPTNGLYKVSNKVYYIKNKAPKQKDSALTMFFPVHARKNFPCFDDPSMKARFTLMLMYSRGYRALSNMPLLIERQWRDLTVAKFQTSPKMPTYLLNYYISDYTSTETSTARGTKIRVWSPKQTRPKRSFALDIANKTLPFYESLFGIPYQLPKLDMVTVSKYTYGAMEHWGLINYVEDRLLVWKAWPTRNMMAKQSAALLVAHEIVHQWFGNMVTLKWWNDVVIHEGVAEYLEFLGAANALPTYNIMEQFYNMEIRAAMKTDSLRSAKCISQKVMSSKQASRNVVSLVYTKGASILRMLHQYVGDDAFLSGLKIYLKKFAYGNADQNDLWDSISETSNIEVSSVMQSWTLQPGFPIITASAVDNEQVFLTQRRFIAGEHFPGKVDNTTWRVPITYVTSKDPKKVHHFLLTSSNSTIKVEGDWIKLNVDANGYYIVNYDVKNWQRIIKQLRENHNVFSALDRASMIKDAFTMAEEGLLSIKIALATTTYLSKETEWIPWQYAKQYISEMVVRLPRRSKLRSQLTEYFWNMSKPIFHSIGWKEKTILGERFLQETVVTAALNAGDDNATKVSNEIFHKWMVNNTYIPDNIAKVVYFYGVRNGNEKEWLRVFRELGFEREKERRTALLNALGGSRNSWTLNKLLRMSLLTRFISLADAINAVADGSRLGRTVAWNFVKTNWKQLPFSGRTVIAIQIYVQHVVEKFANTYHYEDVYRFFRTKFAKRKFPPYVEAILKKIRYNVRWVKSESSEVEDWFENK